jgi:ABC-type polysaccharide/polyol phosphate transport system ATPase subunit
MNSPLLDIQNLQVVFRLQFFKDLNLRDTFIRYAKNPLELLNPNQEVFHVLQNINLKAYKGDRIGLIGKNGAGKSTLLRCIAGMYHQNAGTIKVDGEVRAIFDTALGIQPELSGRENAKLLSLMMFPHHKNLTGLVEEALTFSGLGHFLDVPFKNYSKGMQARLSLSLISASPCDLLILDEVFDGADKEFQGKISERVLEMIEKSGAVIFVSHSDDQIRKACNRVIVIDDHQIKFDGEVEEGLKFYNQKLNLTN